MTKNLPANAKNNTQISAQAEQKKQRMGNLIDYFEKHQPDFAALMPEDKVASFMRIFKNAVIKDPEVAEASHSSIFIECQKCAMDGLVLDGREAALIRFNTNKKFKDASGKWQDKWTVEVVYIPMVRGIRKLVARSPRVKSWVVDIVYENEIKQGLFKMTKGDSPSVYHEPIIFGDRGKAIAAYSVVRFNDGSINVEVMTAEEVSNIRRRTRSKYKDKNGEEVITGPWASDESEMWKKTVAHRHFKSLPLDPQASAAVERIEGLYDFNKEPDESAYSLPAGERKPAPKSVENKRRGSVAEKFAKPEEQAADDQDQQDAGTDQDEGDDPEDDDGIIDGEVIDNDEGPRDGDAF